MLITLVDTNSHLKYFDQVLQKKFTTKMVELAKAQETEKKYKKLINVSNILHQQRYIPIIFT